MFRPFVRAALFAGAASMLLAARPTAASAQWNPSLVVKLGANVPIGDFGDATNLGYTVGIGGEFRKRTTPVGFRLELDFYENEIEHSDVKWRHFAGIANATYQAPSSNLYLIGGLGVYRSYFDFDNQFDDDNDFSETNLGLNGGAGLRFNLTDFSTFVEARFHHQFSDGGGITFLPITFGVRF